MAHYSQDMGTSLYPAQCSAQVLFLFRVLVLWIFFFFFLHMMHSTASYRTMLATGAGRRGHYQRKREFVIIVLQMCLAPDLFEAEAVYMTCSADGVPVGLEWTSFSEFSF